MDPKKPENKFPKEPLSSVRNFWSKASARSKMLIKIVCAALFVVLLASAYGYWNAQSENAKNDGSVEEQATEFAAPVLTPEQQIKQIQDSILEGRAQDSVELRMVLANLYETQSNHNRAIFNYEKAKSLANPVEPNYQATIDKIDQAIIRLKASH